MKNEASNPVRIGRAAMAAAAVLLCAPLAWSYGQHANTPALRSAPAPRSSAPGLRYSRPRPQNRPPTGYPANRSGPLYPGPPYMGPNAARPAFRGYAPPTELPSGHLGDWLNQHRNLPVLDQERLLRAEPGFRRLAPDEQQRVVSQLHQVDELTEEQRQRRLARAEIIEHLSPQDRMRVNLSARRWAELPVDRQAQMKSAFRDLRTLPLNQRPIELNSARYRELFSQEERGILSDMLRVEPYQPAR